MSLDFSKLETELKTRGRINYFPNGVVLVSEDVPGFGLLQGGIEIQAGWYHDTREKRGTMHALEHMLFKGSSKYSTRQSTRLGRRLGLSFNGATDLEFTSFPIESANSSGFILQPHFEETVSLLLDMVYHPLLDERMLKKER